MKALYQHTSWVNLKRKDLASPVFDIMQFIRLKSFYFFLFLFKKVFKISIIKLLVLSQELPMWRQFSFIRTFSPQWNCLRWTLQVGFMDVCGFKSFLLKCSWYIESFSKNVPFRLDTVVNFIVGNQRDESFYFFVIF